jgi:hypothetical protein
VVHLIHVACQMPVQPAKPLSVGRAVSCALVNQLATPGLGSLIGRRMFVGTGHLLLALAGFALLVGWMTEYYYRLVLQEMDKPVPTGSYGWMAGWGAICFGASWLWSLVTSLSLIRQAKANEQAGRESVPPRIAGPPPANPGTPG